MKYESGSEPISSRQTKTSAVEISVEQDKSGPGQARGRFCSRFTHNRARMHYNSRAGELATVERDIEDLKLAEQQRVDSLAITKASVVCRVRLSLEVYDSER
jgi:hypothetical protein